MQKVKVAPFKVVGISVRTTNENAQAFKDIGQLWEQFKSGGIGDKIPNKMDSTIYSIYTNFESDHTKPYDTILGCKVSTLDNIPDGMVGHTIDGGTYCSFVSKGDLTKGVVFDAWSKIWQEDLDRTYTSDFEIYGAKAQNPVDAEVDILVAVRE